MILDAAPDRSNVFASKHFWPVYDDRPSEMYVKEKYKNKSRARRWFANDNNGQSVQKEKFMNKNIKTRARCGFAVHVDSAGRGV